MAGAGMRKPEDDLPEQMKLLDFVIVDYINFFFPRALLGNDCDIYFC